MKYILIIEDDKALSNGIKLALNNENTTITQCYDIKSARQLIKSTNLDLIILDVNLPDENGLNFLCEIKKSENIPVIMLTANDLETDVVAGLEMGADDYITKPFSLAVLRARINTQLRQKLLTKSNIFTIDEFMFDFDKMEFFKNSYPLELSKTEQKLLRLLLENKGFTLERSFLVNRIWTDGADYVDENALSVSIKRLRDKIEDNVAKPKYIKTVYGIGYTWAVK